MACMLVPAYLTLAAAASRESRPAGVRRLARTVSGIRIAERGGGREG